MCLVDVETQGEAKNTAQANKIQQEAEAEVVDAILHEIRKFDVVNLSAQMHVYTPSKAHLSMLRAKIERGYQVSISFVEDYSLSRAKDCVILSTGIAPPLQASSSTNPSTSFPSSTLSAMMRGKAKLIIVSSRQALGKVKGLGNMMGFFAKRAGTHIFKYKL